jgi:hypothetical protein
MNGYIRLSEVLDKMDQLDDHGKGIEFHMKFVTCDKKQDTGGEIIEIINGRKCIGKKKGKVIFDGNVKNESKVNKNPNHFMNQTRNILLENGQIRKVHIRLIIEFNHYKVCF